MTINLFWLCAIGIIAAMAGFWSGRWSMFMQFAGDEKLPEVKVQDAEVEDAEDILAEERIQILEKPQNMKKRKNSNNEKRIPLGWAIGSPAEGAVYTFNDGRRKGAMVRSTQGCLYAPVSGKIVKLYPMGNQMILRTDFGVELLLRVGGVIDEITGEYFRPRILQNEIVNKGKLLLEYDREKLIIDGEDTDIYISVEAAEDYRNITVTEKTQVKLGEEILWVTDRSRIVASQDSYYSS